VGGERAGERNGGDVYDSYLIMDLAVEGGILREPIDIEAFADESFATEITNQ